MENTGYMEELEDRKLENINSLRDNVRKKRKVYDYDEGMIFKNKKLFINMKFMFVITFKINGYPINVFIFINFIPLFVILRIFS